MTGGIIAAGNWIVDRVKTIDRWPEQGTLCNILAEEVAGGGGPCNVLFDLAMMDPAIPLAAAGRVGDDDGGRFLLAEIDRRGIDRHLLKIQSGVPTAHTDVMSGEGKRTFFHCRGANDFFGVEDLLESDASAKIFYLGYLMLLDRLDADDPDYGIAGARLLDAMRQRGMLTVVDFVSEAPEKFRRAVQSVLPYIDVLVINEIEAGNSFGMVIRRADGTLDRTALAEACRRFIAGGAAQVIVHYPEGAYALTADGTELEIPSCKVERIAGTNGAGDAFCAGVLYGLYNDLPLAETLRLASASAAFNLGSPTASGGAVPVAELRKFLAAQG
ncbi:MAG: carbohydrate kinase family protein [Victivallaceae bacterium]